MAAPTVRPVGCSISGLEPTVGVLVGTDRYDATAVVVDPDDPDYARLWKLVNAVNGNRYDAYQSKTKRPIPLVALERRAAT